MIHHEKKFGKLTIMVVSFLGTLGLAFSLLYFIATLLVFIPGFAWVAKIMVGDEKSMSYGLFALTLPCLLMITHLYFRTRLGIWLFERGNYSLAKEYCTRRQHHNLLRSKAEALANQSVLLALLIQNGDWSNAKTFALSLNPARKNPWFWYWEGWVAELWWRLDDKRSLEARFKKHGNSKGKFGMRYESCRTQYFFEEGDISTATQAYELGSWGSQDARIKIAFATLENNLRAETQTAWEEYLREIPSAQTEFALLFSEPILAGISDPRSLRLLKQCAQEEE